MTRGPLYEALATIAEEVLLEYDELGRVRLTYRDSGESVYASTSEELASMVFRKPDA